MAVVFLFGALALLGGPATLLLASASATPSQAFDCDDLIPGSNITICDQKSTKLRQVDGCQNPCLAAAGCTVPVYYDCRVCPTCKITSTTPAWHDLKCPSWQTGGGQCNASAGCPECVAKITSCPAGGEFLPFYDQAHKAVGVPPKCRMCSAGRFSETVTQGIALSNGGMTLPHNFECLKCPRGYFQDLEGQSTCKQCDLGSVTDTLGFSGAISCVQCFPGQFSATPISPCNACESGKSTWGNSGSTSCVGCDEGRFSDSNRVDCKACAVGQFQPEAGQEVCEICPGGRYEDTTGSTKCKRCSAVTPVLPSPVPNDASAHDEESDCVSCQDGFSSSADGSTECSTCMATEYNKLVEEWKSFPSTVSFRSDGRGTVLAVPNTAKTFDEFSEHIFSSQLLRITSGPNRLEYTVRRSFLMATNTDKDILIPLGDENDAFSPATFQFETIGAIIEYKYVHNKCLPCRQCGCGKSLFKDDGALSCSGREPGECRSCDVGFFKSDSAPAYESCKSCAPGKTSNANYDACVWCDTELTAEVVAEWHDNRACCGAMQTPQDNGCKWCNRETCPLCSVREFPNEFRTGCQSVTDVTMTTFGASTVGNTAGGIEFRDSDSVLVQWGLNNVPKLDVFFRIQGERGIMPSELYGRGCARSLHRRRWRCDNRNVPQCGNMARVRLAVQSRRISLVQPSQPHEHVPGVAWKRMHHVS